MSHRIPIDVFFGCVSTYRSENELMPFAGVFEKGDTIQKIIERHFEVPAKKVKVEVGFSAGMNHNHFTAVF